MVQTRMQMRAWLVSGLIALAWVSVSVAAESVTSQRANEIPAKDVKGMSVSAEGDKEANASVLLRVGPTVITQRDFDDFVVRREYSWEAVYYGKSQILLEMAKERQFLLWLKAHPDFVSQERIEDWLKPIYQREGVASREQLIAKAKAEGRTTQLENFLDRLLCEGGFAELERRKQKAADTADLRARFDQEPNAFNGSQMQIRHILIAVPIWMTPEQRQAQRDKLAKIRSDIVSGRRTWEQCINESDDLGTRANGGMIGYISRYVERFETMGKAAFETPQGQISEIFETPEGFHILQVVRVYHGKMTLEQNERWVKRCIMEEPAMKIAAECNAQFPIVGVREPSVPPKPATQPASSPSQKDDETKKNSETKK
ncbi:MAG: peptidylprolyl isomerase [Phycisphaerae bacterium]|nr:peptidylprolyl isomerase [Phycisphaerae bacterium]